MWTFEQSTGRLYRNDGELAATGYSGRGEYKNEPSAEHIADWGPIPDGAYIMDTPVDTKTHGPFVLWLFPRPTNDMHGRSGFGIHGDSVLLPGTASEGCVILPRATREAMWNSGDHVLKVVATL
jgi:hypothetical protein